MATSYLSLSGLTKFKENTDAIYAGSMTYSNNTLTLLSKDGKTLSTQTINSGSSYSNATTSQAGLMSASDKTKLDGINLSNYALKSDIASVINYKGSVSKYSDLPTSPSKGDMYNIETADATNSIKAGDNVVYTGTAWDNVGGVFDITAITDEQINALFTS